MKPLIGILLGSKPSSFSPDPHYAMECSYFAAVTKAGGMPVGLGYDFEGLEQLWPQLGGIILPGGSFAFQADWFEEEGGSKLAEAESWAQSYDYVMRKALETNKPFLGICAGMQALAGVLGNKLTANVVDKLSTNLPHPRGKHEIDVKPDSLLGKLYQTPQITINSHHSEAVVSVKAPLQISAMAEDGCIEAIELPDHPFALGLQWHPEELENGKVIFDAFLTASRQEALNGVN